MDELLKRNYFQNSILAYLTALSIFIICLIIIYLLKKIVFKSLSRWSDRTGRQVDNIFLKLLHRLIIPFLYYGSFYYAIKTLTLNPKIASDFDIISGIIVTFILTRLVISTINYFLDAYFRRLEQGLGKQKPLKGINTLISIFIWILAVIFLLDNLNFKISAVITGLGIGGVAVALAAQAVLKDFFSYFVLFFDRPFELGDFITFGDKSGNVEQIGIKTTKLRAVSGELIIIPNSNLTDSKIHNFKRMGARRLVVFKIGVIYETTKEQLEEIPRIVKKVIEEQKNVSFDRGHFTSYENYSLNFEFAYYVNSPDYLEYMNIQQAINLNIFDMFNKKSIKFAYPTQTILLNNNDKK
jgi:small-conductance mechanosensitive channel